MFYPDCYNYYPLETSARYIKWFDNHDDDMAYRYNGGKLSFSKQEIIELGEVDKITSPLN